MLKTGRSDHEMKSDMCIGAEIDRQLSYPNLNLVSEWKSLIVSIFCEHILHTSDIDFQTIVFRM